MYNYSYNGSYNDAAAALGVALIVWLIIGIAASVLMLIVLWKIFTKAGEGGWKILIPFYGEYTYCKIAWAGKIFWIMLAIVLVPVLVMLLGVGVAAGGSRSAYGAGATITGIGAIAWICAGIALAVLGIIMTVQLGKRFGKSGGFIAGMILLPVVFYPILAFGSSVYEGGIQQGGSSSSSSSYSDPTDNFFAEE